LQVPCPPQVESIAIPFQDAASKTLTPVGTLIDLFAGKSSILTLPWPECSINSGSIFSLGIYCVGCCALNAEIQFAPQASLPSKRSAALTEVTISLVLASIIALVSPAAIAIGRNEALTA